MQIDMYGRSLKRADFVHSVKPKLKLCLFLSPPLGGSLLGCRCIYKEFFFGLGGI